MTQHRPPTPIELARAYVARGWRPFPVPHESKVPGPWGAKTASEPNDAMLRLWFPEGQPMNIGIGCKGSDLLVVDEDAPGELDRLCVDLGTVLPPTYIVHTRKGRHFYFRDTERIMGNRTKVGGRAIDVRAGRADNYGGYVVAAGSFVRGEDGALTEYLAEDSHADVAELPGWLRAWLTQTADGNTAAAPTGLATVTPLVRSDRTFTTAQANDYLENQAWARIREAQSGTRNDALYRAAVVVGHFLGARGNEGGARAKLRELALRAGLGPDEVEKTITSGLQFGAREPYTIADPPPSTGDPAPPRLDVADAAPATVPDAFLLPREIWAATPKLKHIYQAAMAQLTCPDAVLHATLAILASLVHHGTRVHTGKRPSVLSYYFAPVAPSGGGKSEALACARELLQGWSDERFAINGHNGQDYIDGPVGSGEGLIEAFIDDVHEDVIDPETKQPALDNNGNVKTRKVRKQARHNALFHTDEGRQVLAIDSRKGATVLAVLCELWSGAVAGQTNADKDRSRKLPAGTYTVGMLLGFQTTTIDPLFADEAGGAPQRFAFAPATYSPHADDLDAEDEEWPGALRLEVNPGPVQVHLGPDERREVRRHVRLQSAGRTQGGPLDGHRMLLRCRVAALLALLHANTVGAERLDVSTEMWELAGTVVNYSCAVRDHLAASGQRRKATEAQAADERTVRRQVQAARSTAEDAEQRKAARIERVAAVVARRVLVAGADGATSTQARDAVGGRDRDALGDATAEAITRGWVVRGEGNRARLYPGPQSGDVPR